MNLLTAIHRDFFLAWPMGERFLVYQVAGQSGQEIPPPFEAKSEPTEAPSPETKKETAEAFLPTPEGLQQEAQKQYESLKTKYSAEGFSDQEKAALQYFQKEIAQIKANYDSLFMKALNEPLGIIEAQSDLTEKTQKLIDTIHSHAEKGTLPEIPLQIPKEVSEKLELTDIQQRVTDIICERYKVKNTVLMAMIGKVVQGFEFNQNQTEQIGRKTIELTAEQEKQIKELIPKIQPENDAEMTLLQNAFKDKNEIFREKNNPISVYLSRHYEITQEQGKKEIKIDGTMISSAIDLKKYLPEKQRDGFAQMIESRDESTKKTLIDTFNNINEIDKASLEFASKFLNEENLKQPGFLELIGSIIALWKSFKVAMESGDWETLGDVFADFKGEKGPTGLIESVKKSKDAYKEKIEKTEPPLGLSQLLKIYSAPRGEEAKDFFQGSLTPEEFKGNPLGKYRMEAKTAISEYLATDKALGVSTMGEIKKLDSGMITIEAYNKSGQKVFVELIPQADGSMKGRVLPYTNLPQKDSEGKETTVFQPKATDNNGNAIEQVAMDMKSLKTFIEAGSSPVTIQSPPPAVVGTQAEGSPPPAPDKKDEGASPTEKTQ